MSYDIDAFATGMSAFYAVYMFVCYGMAILSYVLKAVGLYTIAKRRGINHPWMSWIPLLDMWVLGCISDQYQYVVKGKTKNKRKWLVGLNIATVVVYIAYIVFLVVMGIGIATEYGAVGEMESFENVAGFLLAVFGGLIPLLGFAFAVAIIRYMAMYDLYSSCTPQNNVLFLVLSIFFNVTEPFFLFFIRKKDGGMPPRRDEPQTQTAVLAQSPVNEPQVNESPVNEPPQEPWENPEIE